ncbi:hypothetical protein HO133_001419 [Letharia lupina]|uniref:Uncharacterized protein n=1 Tax=Letharia lupina TaxID=560253 RepID=A0A8H6FC17_9LECA|nr:uncharacterized protein HO133_001419 [Letharia lupina]KAF6222333.1 hypothetical protein HO133_001419 [Letharia lupina]
MSISQHPQEGWFENSPTPNSPNETQRARQRIPNPPTPSIRAHTKSPTAVQTPINPASESALPAFATLHVENGYFERVKGRAGESHRPRSLNRRSKKARERPGSQAADFASLDTQLWNDAVGKDIRTAQATVNETRGDERSNPTRMYVKQRKDIADDHPAQSGIAVR